MSNAGPKSSDTDAEVRRVVAVLTESHGGGAPGDVIERAVRESFERFRDVRVRDFVPLFVERQARERLRTSEDR